MKTPPFRHMFIWLLIGGFWGMAASIQAQDLTPDQAFIWSATAPATAFAPGDQGEIQFVLTIAENHYVYRDSVSIRSETVPGITLSDPIYPEATLKYDKYEEKDVAIYEGVVEIRVPFTITDQASQGEIPIHFTARHRGCSPEICFLPAKNVLDVSIRVGEADALPTSAGFIPIEQAPEQKSDLFSKGLLYTFLVIFLGGVGTCFTPCVYPLIPITITIFGAKDVRRWKAFTLSVTYVLGICLMFSALGLTAAGTGAVFGSVMANPIVVGIVMLVLAGFGFSMLGLFEIRVPSTIQARLSSLGGRGYGGAFGMGLVAGIIAAPCTGPVLGTVLIYVASSGNLFLGFWLLFTYALGIGTLFILLGTFSGAISYLPRSGVWMEGVKAIFGIILLAMALYFGKSAFPVLGKILKPLPAGLSLGCLLVLVSLPLGAIHRSFHGLSGMRRPLKSVGIVLAVLGLYLSVGAFTTPQKSLIDWIYDEQAGLDLARAEQKPVVIDVWAEWCAACIELDMTTFRDPRVVQRLKDFVTVKLDFTEETPERERLQKKYSIPGMPVLLFYSRSGEYLPDAGLIGYHSADEFLAHLDKIVDSNS